MSGADKTMPFMDQALVAPAKITNYLLSLTHPIGRAKAGFFLGCGFTPEYPQGLIDALIAHAKTHSAYSKPSPYGLKYIVEGALDTPARGPMLVCSVWMMETGSSIPTFVTAYPIKRTNT